MLTCVHKIMGNATNVENWAAQERLRSIERAIWWRGWLKRKDLQQLFGISLAQASSDLQKYLEINPGAMAYHLNNKRYQSSGSMECIMHTPSFEDALRTFLPDTHVGQLSYAQQADSAVVSVVALPNRTGNPAIQRLVMQAFLNDKKLNLKYWSVNSGNATLRSIVPRAFGHDGYRWHVRAWCCENNDYRDFVMSRISEVKEVTDLDEDLPGDEAWETREVVRLKPNSQLSENAQRAIEMDYDIRENGVLELEVRSAMKHYLLSHMRVSEIEIENHFELV